VAQRKQTSYEYHAMFLMGVCISQLTHAVNLHAVNVTLT